jgi:hypothetical protein
MLACFWSSQAPQMLEYLLLCCTWHIRFCPNMCKAAISFRYSCNQCPFPRSIYSNFAADKKPVMRERSAVDFFLNHGLPKFQLAFGCHHGLQLATHESRVHATCVHANSCHQQRQLASQTLADDPPVLQRECSRPQKTCSLCQKPQWLGLPLKKTKKGLPRLSE